eukprot:m.84381 g.84381  ORF g.84381 m.84381 type:complete len:152 (-) comp12964_c0_seq1:3444-3899(-)
MGGQPSKRVTMTREREGNISVTRDFLEDMAEYEINGGKMHDDNATEMTSRDFERRLQSEVLARTTLFQQQMSRREKEIEDSQEDLLESTLARVQSRFRSRNKQTPCQDVAAMVAECMKDNPNRSLECSTEVQAFLQCSDEAHKEHLSRFQA